MAEMPGWTKDNSDEGMKSMPTNNKTKTTNKPQQTGPHPWKCCKRGTDGETGTKVSIIGDHHNGEGCDDTTQLLGGTRRGNHSEDMATGVRTRTMHKEKRLQWADQCGQMLCQRHESQRTHHRHESGGTAKRSCRRRMIQQKNRQGWKDENLAIKYARKRATNKSERRAERRDRQARAWTTMI